MLRTLKSKITFKRILAFFALVFILWVICDYYLFRYLVANKSGWYVYDKKLYDEILAINQNRNSYMINDFSGAFCILEQKSYQKGEFVDIILLNDLLRL